MHMGGVYSNSTRKGSAFTNGAWMWVSEARHGIAGWCSYRCGSGQGKFAARGPCSGRKGVEVNNMGPPLAQCQGELKRIQASSRSASLLSRAELHLAAAMPAAGHGGQMDRLQASMVDWPSADPGPAPRALDIVPHSRGPCCHSSAGWDSRRDACSRRMCARRWRKRGLMATAVW